MTERDRAIELAISQIERQFGKGAIMKMGEANSAMQIDSIPTGSIALDLALGIGGIPRGRITEIYGPESSGKTTLALHVIAEAQRMGGMAAYIDAEHALDPLYASRLGVNLEELLISQPDTGEQALEIVETLVRSSAIDVIVIDSVAALVPKAEIDGDMGDSHMGLQARLMSQALRKLTGNISRTKTSRHLHQPAAREDRRHVRQSPETTTGGNALKFYCSVRHGHPPDRDDQERHRFDRLPGAGEGGQEQGRPALPPGRVRHHVQRGHLGRRLDSRCRHRHGHRQEERRLVQPWRRAAGSGPGEREDVPEAQPGCDELDQAADHGRHAGDERPPRLRRRRETASSPSPPASTINYQTPITEVCAGPGIIGDRRFSSLERLPNVSPYLLPRRG